MVPNAISVTDREADEVGHLGDIRAHVQISNGIGMSLICERVCQRVSGAPLSKMTLKTELLSCEINSAVLIDTYK